METSKKYSIIIPVYNAEKFLSRTLDSLKNQTYRNIEIVLINDGSTDNSENVIKNYISNNNLDIKYKRIENSGPSTARNLGLDLSTGEYVCYLDADDLYKSDLFSNIAKVNQDYDICYFGWEEINEDGEKIFEYEKRFAYKTFINGREAFLSKFKKQFWICNCNAVYKKDFLLSNKLTYIKGVFSGEDANFIYKALYCANNICYLRGNYFVNNIRKQSLSHAPSIDKMFTEFVALDDLKKFLIKDDTEIKNVINAMFLIARLSISKKIINAYGYKKFYEISSERMPKLINDTLLLTKKEKLENFLYEHSKMAFYILVKVYYKFAK